MGAFATRWCLQGIVTIIGVILTPNGSYITDATLTLQAEQDVSVTAGGKLSISTPSDMTTVVDFGRSVAMGVHV